MAKNRGPDGRHMETGVASVSLTSGAGTTSVSYQNAFNQDPEVMVVSNSADAGAYTAASQTVSGFTVTVASSDITTDSVRVVWVAVEKR